MHSAKSNTARRELRQTQMFELDVNLDISAPMEESRVQNFHKLTEWLQLLPFLISLGF